MKNNISQALTLGLLAGYGGQTKFGKAVRGTFEVSSSHFENNKIVYHDEWTNGGGQEIIKSDGDFFTRVYAGGAINKNVSTKEIIQKLIFFIQELKDQTRLFSNCSFSSGNWDYEYKILDREEDFDITVGKETIKYQNETVFVHCFVLSPIK